MVYSNLTKKSKNTDPRNFQTHHDEDSQQGFIPQINFGMDMYHTLSQHHQTSFLHRHSETRRPSQLDSPNGLFTLRFYTPEAYPLSNNTYIAVVFNRGQGAPVDHKAVWIANRDHPVFTNSTPLLTLGTRGDRSHPRMKLSANTRITSWLTPSNPAPGPFTLEWDPSQGELVIRRGGMAYWRSGRLVDYDSNYFENVKIFENFYRRPDPYNFNYNLTSEGDYFMYTVIHNRWTMDSRKVTSGWLLDETGNITTIDRPMVLVMASVCYGYNSGDDLYDKGCELWEQPKCLKRRQVVDLRSGYFTSNSPPVPTTTNTNAGLSLSDCRDACWKWDNCECAGYQGGEGYGCSYWIGRDLKWEQDFSGNAPKIYVIQSSPKAKEKYIGIILGVVSAVVLLILALVLLIMRNRKVKREEELHELLTLDGYTGSYELDNRGANGHQLKLFTYASIISATNNFSSNNKLGEGGFGPVYKGRTGDGQDIAVKLLSRKSGQGLLEFKNELILISELQHVNLVKLIGFCIHKEDKMIIYDYMPNKSLDCFLFSPSGREQLDWEKRFNIIEGTAQGLLYLHKHSRLRIIHRDMKPNNILLDHNMTPKISDFGLARIFKEDTSEVNTNRRVGTYGYMAPEYAMQGIFSVKSDVYSYGVLVLEIVSGRKNNSFHDIEGPLSIVEYAWELWRKDDALQLMDPMLKESCVLEQLRKCIHIGLLCVENHAVDRPTIEDVLFMLKNETATLPMPKNPSFITRNSVFQQVDKATPQQSSDNQVTLSQLSGR
ncbi:hypothetical protein SASPL_149184 [Salvia splendens]|uniref:non-specific serine/threonine protein kinase n=1 Tax=Salvia splendens TaxID=180675 RepID=A0A8X8WB94_SALSN|nr:hypothetical protein SASPL_149184 [Salvia splendens]